jgi:hypothetical protein
VHKDRISRGDVVIRKDVFSENQTVQVPLLHLDFLHVDLVEFIAAGKLAVFASAQHPASLPSITIAGTLRTPC